MSRNKRIKKVAGRVESELKRSAKLMGRLPLKYARTSILKRAGENEELIEKLESRLRELAELSKSVNAEVHEIELTLMRLKQTRRSNLQEKRLTVKLGKVEKKEKKPGKNKKDSGNSGANVAVAV